LDAPPFAPEFIWQVNGAIFQNSLFF